jgi:hypothetical protein
MILQDIIGSPRRPPPDGEEGGPYKNEGELTILKGIVRCKVVDNPPLFALKRACQTPFLPRKINIRY